MSKRVCIYCSSSNILEDKYVKAADQFAQAASSLGYTVVSGGSIRGLMGVIANRMLSFAGNGKCVVESVVGVIPSFMKDMEIQHPAIQNIHIVDTMSRRKELMRENTDAVVAFPGGMGTLEEFLETLTLKRLGRYDGSVILFNQNGYYDGLISLLDYFASEKTMNSNYRDSLEIAATVEEVICLIEKSKREFLLPHTYLPGKI